jgi:hypothetical protein
MSTNEDPVLSEEIELKPDLDDLLFDLGETPEASTNEADAPKLKIETEPEVTEAEPQAEATPQKAINDLSQEQVEAIRSAQAPAKVPQQVPDRQPVAETAQPRMTREELERSLGRVVVSPEMASAILGIDATEDQVKQLQTVLDGVSQFSMRGAAAYIQHREAALRQDYDSKLAEYQRQVAPLAQSYQQEQLVGMVNKFYAANPDLTPYQSVVNKVVASMKGQISDTDTFEEASSKIAAETRTFLTSLGIKPETRVNHRTPATSVVPKMNTLSAGGRSQSRTEEKGKSKLDGLLFDN